MLDSILSFIELIVGWLIVSAQMLWGMYTLPFTDYDTWSTLFGFTMLIVGPIIFITGYFAPEFSLKLTVAIPFIPVFVWLFWSFGFFTNGSNY